MKVLLFLAILPYSVFCEATNSTINQYCEETCNDVCVPCQEPIKCTEDQKDCGLGKPDPAFGGVCPPHSICVAKDSNCPCYNEKGMAYPLTTIVNCAENEIICTGASPGNGCPGQDVCVSRGLDNKGNLCDGFCPVECEENQLHCSTNSVTGCAQPPLCVPKSVDSNGKFCATQQCPIICIEVDFFCAGVIIEFGCKEKDTCVPKGMGKTGELCAGKCPVTCDPITEKECEGQVDITGCKGPDVCHARARNLNGEFCPDNSDSHGCPIICPEDEILCPAKMTILGCKEEATCVKKTQDITGSDCPEASICPTICQPNEVPCEGGTDENGCKKPNVCIPQERDYNGNLCPIHCPAICGENQILCEGSREPLGCKMADTCSERGTKTKGDDIGGLCHGHCPVTCKYYEVKCSSEKDCDGCSTEEICHPQAKDNNGVACEDDSASHNCPVECDETLGHVICPTYETTLGCKPKAMCIPRPEISKGEYCPSHSVCLKECQSDEMLCSDGVDSRGCKNADLCLARGADNDGNLCPALCPPTCTGTEFFCAGTTQNNGCRGEAYCVEKKTDVNGIECPEVCSVFCTENQHRIPGGTDARGCPVQDTCVVPCTGGDSCCNSLTNKCDVGEGDCDSDADCLDGLKCGEDNCPTTRSSEWDLDDDCCYKPCTPSNVTGTQYTALDGCSTNGDVVETQIFDVTSASAEVACCSIDGQTCTRFNPVSKKCWTGDDDAAKATWNEAHDMCTCNGYRLCKSQEELNRCCGSGCQYDNTLVWTSLEGPNAEQTGTVTIKSNNFPTRHWWHGDSNGNGNDLFLSEGTPDYTLAIDVEVPGLSGDSDSASFKSVDDGKYVYVDDNDLLWLKALSVEASTDLKKAATFKIIKDKFFDGFVAFESISQPGKYVRHSSFRLRVDNDDGSDIFKKDSSFELVNM